MKIQNQCAAWGIALAVAMLCCPCAYAQELSNDLPVTQDSNVFNPTYPNNTEVPSVAANAPLHFMFSKTTHIEDGRYAVLLGTEDLTASFTWISPTQLNGLFNDMPLPQGANILRAYQITDDNQWVEIGEAKIMVTAPNDNGQANHPAVFHPRLIIGVKSQLRESHSATATPPLRRTYQDATLLGSFTSEYADDDSSFNSQLNFAGSSYRPEAIDFGVQSGGAPKIDVANYLVQSTFNNRAGVTGLSLGYVQAGNNPLLASGIGQSDLPSGSGIGNRGALFTQKFNDRLDFSAAVQNATSLLGGNNLTGLNDPQHRFTTLALGGEVLERLGGLRIEITSFNGIVKPTFAMGEATLQDAEQSQGLGLRAQSQTAEGDIRSDVVFARSTFTPSGSSTHSIPAGPSVKGNAWYASLDYDVLRNIELSTTQFLSLSLQARHDFSASTYKSLGSWAGADFVSDSLGISAYLGVISSQLQIGQRTDNVDNANAFFKNRAPTLNFNLAAPLGQLFDSSQPSPWLPSSSYSYSRNHNYADRRFIPAWATIADLSNMQSTSHGLDFNWQIKTVGLHYQYSRNLQNNQQIGYELDDIFDSGHTASASYQLNENLSLNGGGSQRISDQQFAHVLRYSKSAQVGMNWRVGDRYTLTPNAMVYSDHDTAGFTSSKAIQSQVQLIKQFDLPILNSKLPGQWSLRYVSSNTNTLGTRVRYESVNAALSLSLF